MLVEIIDFGLYWFMQIIIIKQDMLELVIRHGKTM